MEHYFKNRDEWRKWLQRNSASEKELWLKIYKKHTGKECVPYAEAVEEALCFGWIDGKIKRIDDEYYIQRYTPRNPSSRWSKYNIERVKKLITQGKMTKPGLDAYNIIFSKPHLVYENRTSGIPEIPEELLNALEKNKQALNNFMNFPPSAKRLYIEWFKYAKQEKTRMERLKKIVGLSEINKKPGIL